MRQEESRSVPPGLDTFDVVIGAHAFIPLSTEAQVGFSLANFEQENNPDETKQIAGLDFVCARNRYEFSAEGVYRFSEKGHLWDERGLFGQLVVPLSEKTYAVGRYEAYQPAQENQATQLFVAGLNYRYTPALVLKAEWIAGKNNHSGAPEGLMSSLSILF